MLWQNAWSVTGQTHEKLTNINLLTWQLMDYTKIVQIGILKLVHNLLQPPEVSNNYHLFFNFLWLITNKTFCGSTSNTTENEFHSGIMSLIIWHEYISGHLVFSYNLSMVYSHKTIKLIGSNLIYSPAKVLLRKSIFVGVHQMPSKMSSIVASRVW